MSFGTIDFFSTFFVRCIILMSGFSLSIVSAHFLGPAGRGEYFFVTTLSALLVQFGTFGMQASNVYLVAQDEKNLGSLTTNAIWIGLLISIMSGLTAAIIRWDHHHAILGLEFIAILSPASLFFLIGTNLLIGVNKIKQFNLLQIVGNILVCIVLFSCGFAGYGPMGFIAATSLTWLAVSILVIIVISRTATLPLTFNFRLFRQGFNFGIKTYISTIFGLLVLKGNIFFLKLFTSATILGYYSIASQICDALIILPATYSLLLFPDLVKNQQNRWEKTQKALISIGSSLAVIYIIVGLLAKFLIPFVFGERFAPATSILLWMLPGSFCIGTSSIASQYLSAHNFPKPLVGIWISGFLIMLVTSFALIAKFSGIGAAMSLSITYALISSAIITYAFRFNRQQQTGLTILPNQENQYASKTIKQF